MSLYQLYYELGGRVGREKNPLVRIKIIIKLVHMFSRETVFELIIVVMSIIKANVLTTTQIN